MILIRWLLLGVLRAYKLLVSPALPRSCRFYPSCSDYAYGAVVKHGVIRGIGLAAHRVLRCNPWNPGGVDPVP